MASTSLTAQKNLAECSSFASVKEPCTLHRKFCYNFPMSKSTSLSQIKAVLLDLDGVLYIGDQAIPGAVDAVGQLRQHGFKLAGLTNTTTQSRRVIVEKLATLGFDLGEEDIATPASLAVQAIGEKTARLYVRDALLEDFQDVRISETSPDVIVMGDIGGEGYPPETLREIFAFMMDGSQLLALHKNRFWQKPDGLHLDLGTFVAAIEYATGKQATVVGKPSADFFHGVCHALNVKPDEALMVGDDVESDVAGALHAGLHAVLVETGKYRQSFVENYLKESGIHPDRQLASIADLPGQLIK